jgi:hypothetical protein
VPAAGLRGLLDEWQARQDEVGAWRGRSPRAADEPAPEVDGSAPCERASTGLAPPIRRSLSRPNRFWEVSSSTGSTPTTSKDWTAAPADLW